MPFRHFWHDENLQLVKKWFIHSWSLSAAIYHEQARNRLHYQHNKLILVGITRILSTQHWSFAACISWGGFENVIPDNDVALCVVAVVFSTPSSCSGQNVDGFEIPCRCPHSVVPDSFGVPPLPAPTIWANSMLCVDIVPGAVAAPILSELLWWYRWFKSTIKQLLYLYIELALFPTSKNRGKLWQFSKNICSSLPRQI